ncbi:hypothetical protein EDB89DRAFT_2247578 [Lactarius sanguifluus]|nr:hypothetical protein EDB89DRAFT_2247578 [Lactarius sanguifluus]
MLLPVLSPASSPLYYFPASNPMKKKSTYCPIPGTSAKEDDNILLPPLPLPSGQRELCAPLQCSSDEAQPSMCAAGDDYDGETMTATAADILPTQPTTTTTPGRRQQ